MSEDTEQVTPPKPERSWRKWGIPVAIGGIGAFIFNAFFLQMYTIPSSSMEPTLQVGDYMLSIPLIDNRTPPERGDIVVFSAPSSWDKPDDMFLVKRVIGVGGDIVECCTTGGEVKVNNVVIDEPYLKGDNKQKSYSLVVPEGKIFVLGDNRENSKDSRFYSDPFIPLENVVSQPFEVIYPLNHFKFLNK